MECLMGKWPKDQGLKSHQRAHRKGGPRVFLGEIPIFQLTIPEIETLTLYAFSTEKLERDQKLEVNFLMRLP